MNNPTGLAAAVERRECIAAMELVAELLITPEGPRADELRDALDKHDRERREFIVAASRTLDEYLTASKEAQTA